ncbi:TonB-dependent receptor [Tardibacter chloracetimidivorans]|uniref:TonB-dependent receptor n=1 Tax=Tardibacter chloracetimidivorans TaxID=1921510 RepID=UPI0013902D46|nr:TonB-dependent receptor [Tardibacter chloracetimidivorans]
MSLVALAFASAAAAQEVRPGGGDTQLSADGDASSAVGGGVEDIVVTAQRRNENLQKVPIAVQAFSETELEAAGITSTVDLARITPGLTYGRGVGLGSPFLRGVGTSANGPGTENSVAVYVDGVYYATKASAVTDLESVERIEVLKGPQGTLFGRNASGGLIQIITADPSDDPELALKAGYANYDTVTLSGYGNLPLTDTLAANLSASYWNQGEGWGENIATGNDVNLTDKFNTRGKIKWEPSSSTRVTLVGDYAYLDTSVGLALQPLPGLKPALAGFFTGGKYDVDLDTDVGITSRSGGVSLKVEHEFSFADFLSISAWRGTHYTFVLDNDYTAVPRQTSIADAREDQYSQEFQFSGGTPSTLQWTAGVYLFSYDGNQTFTNRGIGFPTLQYSGLHGRQRAASQAVYAQVTKELFPRTRLTVGGRYTWEKRKLDGYFLSASLAGVVTTTPVPDQKTSFKKPTWRVALEHDFADDVLGYLSYNRGFKSGVYNILSLTGAPVRPEIVDAYEAGLKTTFLDRKVRLNVAAFRYGFQDIQLGSFALAGSISLRNAARAEIYGIDVDFEVAPTSRLRLSGSAEWLHARFTSFPGAPAAVPLPTGGNSTANIDASGNHMIRAPSFTANAAVNYTVPVGDGEIDFNLNYTYSSKSYQEFDEYLFVPELSLVNAQIAWQINDMYKISIWGRNLTNKFYYYNMSAVNLASTGSAADPRTYGVNFEVRF